MLVIPTGPEQECKLGSCCTLLKPQLLTLLCAEASTLQAMFRTQCPTQGVALHTAFLAPQRNFHSLACTTI